MPNLKTDDDTWLQRFQKGSSVYSGIFGTALVVILIAMFWLVPYPTDFQRQLARWIVTICSAFLAMFFFGGIILRGSIRGMKITAGGSFALFVLLAVVIDPFPKVSQPLGQPVWTGGARLGSLLGELADAYADGRIKERITVDPAHRDEIYNFRTESREWTGRTWIELLQKVCVVTPCLKCSISDRTTLQITLSGTLERHCVDLTCSDYWYTCKP